MFFMLLYRNVRFFGALLLALQVAVGLILRALISFASVSPNDVIYDVILLLANLIGFLASYYLYTSNREFIEEERK
jgi:hypothetical protein